MRPIQISSVPDLSDCLVKYLPFSDSASAVYDILFVLQCNGNIFDADSMDINCIYRQGAGTVYPSGAPEFTPRFLVGFVLLDLLFYVCFVDRCMFFCTLSFGYCVVCSFLIYGFLVSSNSSSFIYRAAEIFY